MYVVMAALVSVLLGEEYGFIPCLQSHSMTPIAGFLDFLAF